MNLDITSRLNLSNSSALNEKMNNIKSQSSSNAFNLLLESNENKANDIKEFELKKLKEVSDDFEALFINELLKSMRKTVNKSELIDGGMAENIFEDMLYNEYSKEFAKTNTFGISQMIYNQMERYI